VGFDDEDQVRLNNIGGSGMAAQPPGLSVCQTIIERMSDQSPERELSEDLLAIVHTFSCRLYGLRKYRETLKQALAEDLTR
jgi:predicted site-specific integrase-resolvase